MRLRQRQQTKKQIGKGLPKNIRRMVGVDVGDTYDYRKGYRHPIYQEFASMIITIFNDYKKDKIAF
jgi:hypothetical protein